MKHDSWRPPSLPRTPFPQARGYRSSTARPATTSRQTLQRHLRSTAWFQLYRRGGRIILHHGHIQPVLIRAWSPEMDGITATIWASQTTLHDCARKSLTAPAIVQPEHGCASPLLASARQTLRVRSRDDSWAHRDRDGR
jgi:hypothetical protein